MSEKLKLKVKYEVNEKVVREFIFNTGEYITVTQTVEIDFMKFEKDVKEIIFNWYGVSKGEIQIEIDEKEREKYGEFDNKIIETFPIERLTEEEMVKEVSWFLRMKEKHGETFQEQKVSKTFTSPHLYIFYQIDSAFEKKELVEKRKIVNKYLTAEIPLSAIHEQELEMLHYLGYRAEYDSTKRRDGITLNAVEYEIEGVHPAPRYLNKGNVNGFIHRLYLEKRAKERETKQTGEEEYNSKTEKTKWVETYGSSHLKRAFKLQYNCQRLYVEERTKQEFPNWNLDFDNKLSVKDRPIPSEKALDIEEEMREKHHNIDIRVHWKKEGTGGKEVVVIRNYLGKYTLFQEV